MDMHTHFLRDDTRLRARAQAQAVGKAGWKPDLVATPKPSTTSSFQLVQGDSSTATPRSPDSGAPSDHPEDWFLTNEMEVRAHTPAAPEAATGTAVPRHLAPGQPGWLDEVDRAIAELKPDSWKG